MAAPDPVLSLGFAGIDWIEHFLVHGPGDVQGESIELDDEFAAFIVKACRVKPNGERLIRRAFLSRAKGRNKSGTAAMIACFEALGPARFDHFAVEGEVSYWGYEYETGEPVGRPLTYAEVLCVATEEGQAGNTYDAIHYMLNPETCSPELLAEFGKIDVGLTRTNLPNKRGFIEPVTSADSSKDGGKSTFIVADETHLWVLPRLARLHGVMTRNLLKRKIASGWMLETSTMYGEGEGSVAEGTHAYAKSVRSVRERSTLLFDHKQASKSWDLNKRRERLKALAEAYGPAAEWMNLEAIADSWDDPQVSEAEFRRYWLNQPVPTLLASSVLPKWGACYTESRPGLPAAIGIAVSYDREWASIGAASRDSVPHLGSYEAPDGQPSRRLGTAWVVGEAKRVQDKTGCIVAVDEKGPAHTLIRPLEEAGVTVTGASLADYVGACATLYDAVEQSMVRHGNHQDLNAAIAGAGKRELIDRWAWARRSGEISMLEAVTLALWGASQKPITPPASPQAARSKASATADLASANF